jgi:hypothetical protein
MLHRELRKELVSVGEMARKEIRARIENRPLAEALISSYPSLTQGQLDRLEAAIIREVAAAIRRGDGVAILRELSDGSYEINRMIIDRAARAVAITR